MKKSLAFLSIIFSLGGCHSFEVNSPAVNSTPVSRNQPSPPSTPSPINSAEDAKQESKAGVTIGAISIYGRWWSDEQLENNFNADNPPPKTNNVKLDLWDASQPDSPHPDRLDVSFRVENHTTTPISISLKSVADFKVASYQAIAQGAGTEEALNEKLSNVGWSENRKIGATATHKLLPGQGRDIEFKDFNMRAVIDRYLKPSAGDLWPWKLRVSIIATNSKGVEVARAEKIITVMPRG